jgi:hypothetical protein
VPVALHPGVKTCRRLIEISSFRQLLVFEQAQLARLAEANFIFEAARSLKVVPEALCTSRRA